VHVVITLTKAHQEAHHGCQQEVLQAPLEGAAVDASGTGAMHSVVQPPFAKAGPVLCHGMVVAPSACQRLVTCVSTVSHRTVDSREAAELPQEPSWLHCGSLWAMQHPVGLRAAP
jgi:hypothetical protein